MSGATALQPPHYGATATSTVADEFDVAGVVSMVNRFCADHGLSGVFAAHVATAASELANNLWMYAHRGGQVRVSLLTNPDRLGVELIASDDGPGIANLEQALTDGYSSAGGMGCGLPGVRRLMDEFTIDSSPQRGTCVSARKWQSTHR
jgi:serine/threonine-protein kinase RsbT